MEFLLQVLNLHKNVKVMLDIKKEGKIAPFDVVKYIIVNFIVRHINALTLFHFSQIVSYCSIS